MRRRKIASIDRETGEVLDGVVVYCSVKRNPYTKGWVMNSQEALEILASDEDLTKDALRVLIFLMSRLDFENWIHVTQKEIADQLNIKKQNVSSAMILLVDKEILLKGPKMGRSYAYRLNPDFGWKGRVTNLDEYRQKRK